MKIYLIEWACLRTSAKAMARNSTILLAKMEIVCLGLSKINKDISMNGAELRTHKAEGSANKDPWPRFTANDTSVTRLL